LRGSKLPGMKQLTIKSPEQLLAAVPFMIGFHPEESLVVIAVEDGELLFAARHDLPSAEDDRLWLGIAGTIAAHEPEALLLIGYGQDDRVAPAMAILTTAVNTVGIKVLDRIRVCDGRFWSYECTNPTVYPPEGRECPPRDSVLAAEAVFAGEVALPGRADVVAQIAPVTGEERTRMRHAERRALSRLLHLAADATRASPPTPTDPAPHTDPAPQTGPVPATDPMPPDLAPPTGLASPSAEPGSSAEAGPSQTGAGRSEPQTGGTGDGEGGGETNLTRFEELLKEAGHSAIREAESLYSAGARLPDDALAWLSALLNHVEIRDYALLRTRTRPWEVRLWADLVRRSAPAGVAPAASLLAFVAWRSGLGALATTAVDRALKADPAYELARLMSRVLQAALPPALLKDWPATPAFAHLIDKADLKEPSDPEEQTDPKEPSDLKPLSEPR
jgi:hypothetical protein